MANKQGKMQNLVNYRMRVTLNDGRQMTGQMLAFDKVCHSPLRFLDNIVRAIRCLTQSI
jgi:small nuclear ribonucleoprotein (snRNP)-like protein